MVTLYLGVVKSIPNLNGPLIRLELFERKWLPYLKKLPKQIPLSLGYVGANVLSLLTDDALIAQWNNEGYSFTYVVPYHAYKH